MWVIDIRHWLNEKQDGPAAPQLRLKVKKLGEIITWITSRDRGLPTGEAPKCWRRPERKPCKGILKIQFEIDDRIHWFCPFAYVLAILSKTTTNTALTQMIGRVLRQPQAQLTQRTSLNECY